MNFWQQKLLAFLHDPPCKPFNVGEHREIAERCIIDAGFNELDLKFNYHVCDHIAAAADRLIFPKPFIVHAEFTSTHDSPYHHTLGGGKLQFSEPINSSEAENFVKQLQPTYLTYYNLEAIEDKTFDGFERNGKDWANFFLHWRLWKKFVSEKDPRLVFLPADTRIPDHSIWTHCAITSALQGCVEVEGYSIKSFDPAFLLFQIGPVQEFIAQARKTKDLWSGSYLLSWLIAHAIKAVTDRIGPDAIIYPALFNQPLFDFLHKEELYEKVKTPDNKTLWDEEFSSISPQAILTPNFPNRFLALIPSPKAFEIANAAENALKEELRRIADSCKSYLKDEIGMEWNENIQKRWEEQISSFIQVSWLVYPWEKDIVKSIDLFSKLPLQRSVDQETSPADNLRKLYDYARTRPREELDPRNFRHIGNEIVYDSQGLPIIENSGFCWSAYYAITDYLHAARRNTRDFSFLGSPSEFQLKKGVPKDTYSGKEESIGGEKWQKILKNKLPYLFKENEHLGALNLIKRIWDKAYLINVHKLFPQVFDSVPDIAALDWLKEKTNELKNNTTHKDFTVAIEKAIENKELNLSKKDIKTDLEKEGVFSSFPSLYFQTEIQQIKKDKNETTKFSNLENALTCLKKLQKGEKISKPNTYIAILAMDGDSMGEWLSGQKTPEIGESLAKSIKLYFTEDILKIRRPLFPSFHLELSQALANFSIFLAAPIVKHFNGQLIYSGGDDVLAMLPAEKALICAYVLRMAFRAEKISRTDPDFDLNMPQYFPGVLEDQQQGFVGLNGEWEGWKSYGLIKSIPRGYHLLLMGDKADISAGIAIGHIHSPLQNLVNSAREAEKKAKSADYGKASFVVNLFKRSGEILQWGSKWSSNQTNTKCYPIEIIEKLKTFYNENKISSRFPYRLAELTLPYISHKAHDSIVKENFDELKPIIEKDFTFALSQHFDTKNDNSIEEEKEKFEQIGKEYLAQSKKLLDFLGPFLTFAFFKEKGETG
ncbi:type III-B CRISPR-associated protein Cas10/Cmr2 [Methylacidiphilum caldifontis]|uniref:type III-B CRISPR-associated protein Cas10/Cmr2 n=1 Tax=Methylacidiphilum caldifontis TaxID=2795386 RepID=UPI001A8EAC08|nr:type III-B CRISPR-associated protein Cas10/Cmr2 [Methylacidiphilum caldifontis]QSR89207.1 type III-B CRISPR-associated protein Cas10/Cmr2 [Methylacidiphilum caldifontis]